MRSKTAMQLLDSVARTYETIASDFDRTRQKSWPDFEHFREYIPKHARILDVGCGNGRLLRHFESGEVRSYVGIEPSSKLLAHAREQHQDSWIRFQEGDVLNLKEPSEAYNAVFLLAVLHHIPSRELQRQALVQLSRTISPDGYLFLSVWDLCRLRSLPYFLKALWRAVWTLGDFSWKDLMVPWGRKNRVWRYCHAFTQRELHGLLREAGLEIVASWMTRKGQFGNHLIVARPFLSAREVSVMDVRFHAVTLKEAGGVVEHLLQSNDQHYVVTPNPEILLKARKDANYRAILNGASLSIPDGIGVLWAARYVSGISNRFKRFLYGMWGLGMTLVYPRSLQQIFPERVTGTDLMTYLIHRSHPMKAKVFLLGAAPGVAERVADKWRFDNIVGTYSGSPKSSDVEEIVDRVNASEANLLFVAFGAPSQERWIVEHLSKMPNVKVAMGIGGAFDFVAGVRSRSPRWMQRFGLEWFWRVGQQPTRIKRILDATVGFPLRMIFKK